MADLMIQDAPVATGANLTDRVPASQGDALAKVITVQQIKDVIGAAPAAHTQTSSTITDFNDAVSLAAPAETVTTIKTALGVTTLSGSNTGDQDLSGRLTTLSNTNTQTGTAYTLLTSDLGKDVRFTSATAVTLTLPAYTGFTEGFQCTLHNDSTAAIDITLSGTVVASGTKIAQKKSALLRMIGGSWRCSGGVS